MTRVFVLFALIAVVAACASDTPSESHVGKAISRELAIEDHWDDIKDQISGTETVEACRTSSGSCYDLEAEIAAGTITDVRFPNGGVLSLSADIEQDGTASDIDQRGESWDFTLDLDASIVNEAVNAWAETAGYTVD